MSGDFELENNDEIQGEAARFESMVKKNESKFYDVDQIRDLIDHYLSKNSITWAEKALEWGMRLHPNSSELKLAKIILLYKNNKFRAYFIIISVYNCKFYCNFFLFFCNCSKLKVFFVFWLLFIFFEVITNVIIYFFNFWKNNKFF